MAKRTKQDLQEELEDQLKNLSLMAEVYDRGSFSIAKSMATSLRVLLHHNYDPASQTKSLLQQLNMQDRDFVDTSWQETPGGTIASPDARLVKMRMFTDGTPMTYEPLYDNSPSGSRLTPFDEFWNALVITDSGGHQFTRAQLVKRVANEDGGAHVDGDLRAAYMQLTRGNSMGWISSFNGQDLPNMKSDVVLASIRQMAHEVLRTLLPEYEPIDADARPLSKKPSISLFGPIQLVPDPTTIRRQGPCPCGSGRKYKRCCGN